MVRFDVSKREEKLVRRVVTRAVALAADHGEKLDHLSTTMDLHATIANGCPLDLDRLLAADNFNFLHDVFGISRHLDRETGKLQNHFRPRYAAKEAA
ncbi:hypothetical protein [Hyphomicrobium sp. DY-1]|uniref:DUF6874 family protein n=1 Tax=Hyphomicrobium sp. DY-1 TaxID=3075650 RepID=UPI0039C42A62